MQRHARGGGIGGFHFSAFAGKFLGGTIEKEDVHAELDRPFGADAQGEVADRERGAIELERAMMHRAADGRVGKLGVGEVERPAVRAGVFGLNDGFGFGLPVFRAGIFGGPFSVKFSAQEKQRGAGGAGEHEQDDQCRRNDGFCGCRQDGFRGRRGGWTRLIGFAGGDDEFWVGQGRGRGDDDFSIARGARDLRAGILGVSRNVLAADGAGKFELAHGSGFNFRVGILPRKVEGKCGQLVKRLNGLTELNEFNGLKVTWLDSTNVDSVSGFLWEIDGKGMKVEGRGARTENILVGFGGFCRVEGEVHPPSLRSRLRKTSARQVGATSGPRSATKWVRFRGVFDAVDGQSCLFAGILEILQMGSFGNFYFYAGFEPRINTNKRGLGI